MSAIKYIKPKHANAKQVSWKISENTRNIVSYYAEYTEYSEDEVVDRLLKEFLVNDEQFIQWIKSKRSNKKMLKAVGLLKEEESIGDNVNDET